MTRALIRRAALVAALLLLLASCSSGSDDDDVAGTAGVAEDAVASEAPTPDEVTVSIERDASAAANGTVGPEGGTVEATAADGTEYALQIPAGALPGPVDITMTPLAAMAGLPDGTELAFGVALEPDGLAFAIPSWLYVTADVEPEEVFSGLGIKGDLVSLRGIAFDGEHYVVPVGRFSGAGGARCFPICGGPSGGRPDWPGLPPAGAPGTPGNRPTPPPGPGIPPCEPPTTPPGPGPGSDGGGGRSGTGDSLTDGPFPPGDLDSEIGDAAQDMGDAQVSGDEEAEAGARNRMRNLREKARQAAWNAAERCVNEKDLTAVQELLHWMQTTMLLEAHDDVDVDADDEELNALLNACVQFELEAIGNVEFRLGGDVIVMGDEVDATIPLRFDGGQWNGEQAVDVPNFGFDRGAEFLELLGFGLGAAMGIDVPNDIRQNDYIQCTTTPARGVIGAMVANVFHEAGPTLIVTLTPAGDASVTCPDPINTFPMPPMVMDMPLHIEMGFPGAGGFGIAVNDGWTLGTGQPVATRDIHHEINSEGIAMVIGWHFTINHAPGELPPKSPPRPPK